MNSIDLAMFHVERGLNVAGYIAIGVCSASGALRCIIGIVQGVAGISFGLIASCYSCFCKNPHTKHEWIEIAGQAFSHVIPHAIANIGRGALETIPLAGLVIWLLYDRKGYRISYEGEESRDVLPKYIHRYAELVGTHD